MKYRFQPIPQKRNSCGPSSIYIATREKFMKVRASLRQIERISNYSGKGLSHGEFLETLRLLRISHKRTRFRTWAEFKKAFDEGNPIIVSWMPVHLAGFLDDEDWIGHFSVVEKVTGEFVILVEPAENRYLKMGRLRFLRTWYDYDVLYPRKSSDVKLRWAVILYPPKINKNSAPQRKRGA